MKLWPLIIYLLLGFSIGITYGIYTEKIKLDSLTIQTMLILIVTWFVSSIYTIKVVPKILHIRLQYVLQTSEENQKPQFLIYYNEIIMLIVFGVLSMTVNYINASLLLLIQVLFYKQVFRSKIIKSLNLVYEKMDAENFFEKHVRVVCFIPYLKK